MRLFVCWTSKELHLPRPGGHSCANAFKALRAAGHDPEVVKAHGFGGFPDALQTKTRKLVEEHTGSRWVPALETDDGDWVSGSHEIVAWAQQHPSQAPRH